MVLNYSLYDIKLINSQFNKYDFTVFVPHIKAIVLGRGNSKEESVYLDAAEQDSVPILKRPSGGESVILSPDTVVVGIVKRGVKLQSPGLFFKAYNNMIIKLLEDAGIQNLGQKGISDICIGKKKICGSSIYWHKQILLFHMVINVNEPVETLEKYLKHPSKEPDYRKGRSHSEFVTSLRNEGCHYSPQFLKTHIESGLPAMLSRFNSEMTA